MQPSNPSHPSGKTRSRKVTEHTVYGLHACLSLFEARPDDVVRLFFNKSQARRMSKLKKWCADHKLPYRQLEDSELNKVAGSVHHEGVVLVARPQKTDSIYSLTEKPLDPSGLWVALDRISNTHNFGGILRTCAFFGINGVVLGKDKDQSRLSASAMRTSEGASENLPIYEGTDLASSLRDLKARGAFIVGTDPSARQSLYDTKIKFPCVMVVGNEQDGLSTSVKNRCDALVTIPGEGRMESLNVSVASGILLAEISRQRKKGH